MDNQFTPAPTPARNGNGAGMVPRSQPAYGGGYRSAPPVVRPRPEGVRPLARVERPQPGAVPRPADRVEPGVNPHATQADTVRAAAREEGDKSFLVTFFLALLLGIFGADRFYLKKIGTGVLKLVTLGGIGVWALADQALLMSGLTDDKEGSPLTGYKKNRKIAIGCFVIFWAIIAAVCWYNFNGFMSKLSQCSGDCTASSMLRADASSLPVKPKAIAAATVTPLGQTATGSGDAANFSVKISGIDTNPKTTGQAPDAGKQYLEVDFMITNKGKGEGMLPGTFYYQTAAGKQFADTSTAGIGPEIVNKRVQLAGTSRTPLVIASVKPGQTIPSYLLYQVPKGDDGKVVWYDGSFDTTSTKLAIFDLR